MNRLTEWGTRGVAFIKNLRPCGIPNDSNDLIYEVTKKCAAYEDTGLEPEEVKRVQETLVTAQRLKKEQYDGLEKYLKAEAEGRLIILPCAPGTAVYRMDFNQHDGAWLEPHFFRLQDLEHVGKTIFITLEEAEAALKGVANAD